MKNKESFYSEKIDISHPTLSRNLPLPEGVKELQVDVAAGNLSIEAGPPHQASLELLWGNSSVIPKFEVKEGILFLTAKGLFPFLRQKHAFVYNLVIPPNFAVKARMRAGVIALKGLTGKLKLKISTGGNIQGIIASRNVEADVRAGDIRFWGLSAGNVRVNTLMGNIELVFKEISEKAHVEMRTYLGDVKALFPAYMQPRYQKGKVANNVNAVCLASTLLGDVKVGVKKE